MVRMLGGDENVSRSLYGFMTLNVFVTTFNLAVLLVWTFM